MQGIQYEDKILQLKGRKNKKVSESFVRHWITHTPDILKFIHELKLFNVARSTITVLSTFCVAVITVFKISNRK